MASTAAMAAMALTNTNTARAIVEAHGSEQRRERIGMYFPITPVPGRDSVMYEAYQSELIAGLAEIVEGMITANAEAATPKRGRPKKADA